MDGVIEVTVGGFAVDWARVAQLPQIESNTINGNKRAPKRLMIWGICCMGLLGSVRRIGGWHFGVKVCGKTKNGRRPQSNKYSRVALARKKQVNSRNYRNQAGSVDEELNVLIHVVCTF